MKKIIFILALFITSQGFAQKVVLNKSKLLETGQQVTIWNPCYVYANTYDKTMTIRMSVYANIMSFIENPNHPIATIPWNGILQGNYLDPNAICDTIKLHDSWFYDAIKIDLDTFNVFVDTLFVSISKSADSLDRVVAVYSCPNDFVGNNIQMKMLIKHYQNGIYLPEKDKKVSWDVNNNEIVQGVGMGEYSYFTYLRGLYGWTERETVRQGILYGDSKGKFDDR